MFVNTPETAEEQNNNSNNNSNHWNLHQENKGIYNVIWF